MVDMYDAPTSVDVAETSPQAEARYHTYRTHRIPIYVRLMWVGFYCLAAWYVLQFMFPSIREDFQVEPKARRNVEHRP